MKLFDLRLRGSGFTLGTIVSNTEHDNLRLLIDYLQCNADKEAELPESFIAEKKDAIEVWHSGYSVEDVIAIGQWLVENGYCTEQDGTYTFTEKAIQVFEKTIQIDNELSESGFRNVPCCAFGRC